MTRNPWGSSWWGVYVGFLPPALLGSAQVALLGPATRWRRADPRVFPLAIGAAVGVWGAPAVFWEFYYFRMHALLIAGVAMCAAAAVLDGVLYAVARSRSPVPWPVAGPPLP